MSEPRITVRAVSIMVAAEFGLTLADLRGQTRSKEIAFARHVGFYLASKQLGRTLPEIGTFFGGKDHTTVYHGVRRIDGLIKSDAAFSGRIERLIAKIQAAELEMQLPPEQRSSAAAVSPLEMKPEPPTPREVVVSVPAPVGALGSAVETYLKARKRLEDDRFSAHEAPSRRNEEQALSALRVAHHDYLAGGQAS